MTTTIGNGKKPLRASIASGLQGRMMDLGVDGLVTRAQSLLNDLRTRVRGTGAKTVPCAYMGETVFRPESTTYALDTDQDGTSSNLVNYVVRSGRSYNIPVLIGGDGPFRALALHVSITQRLYQSTDGIVCQMNVMPIVNNFQTVAWTTKFSLYGTQPAVRQSPCINFYWNCQESSTQMMLSDHLLPMSALMPRTLFLRDYTDTVSVDVNPDGDIFRFDAPWRIKQGSFLNFIFRPVTDIVQYDSSMALPGGRVDDRQNGVRDQSVTVQVEVIGERLMGGAS
jgi:hypothetical protein